MDLIRSKTDRAAEKWHCPNMTEIFPSDSGLRGEILETLAHLAVNVDYPEYDAEQLTVGFCVNIPFTFPEKVNHFFRPPAREKSTGRGLGRRCRPTQCGEIIPDECFGPGK